ncbi:MAG TPA: hypothetical protein VFO41_17130, partial [Alphaproteobacteria bacterium]|nr:hypothetical protein [Alphaproteobacteria bacterium]
DLVGGGIFDNDFYTRLVVAFEKRVISDGHEFILGSFTHKSMPIAMWDRLDVVVLTGITAETGLDPLAETSSQVAIIDMTLDGLPYHAYRIDFEPAFRQLFDSVSGEPRSFLYLDSSIRSREQAMRLEAFQRICRQSGTPHRLEVIPVNQETGADDTAALERELADFRPDYVCGYIHHAWVPLIARRAAGPVKVFPYALDAKKSSFSVRSDDWMRQVLHSIYDNLDNRRAEPRVLSFPASFRP